jgi:Ca2+-binding EF-hand superfamily protein
LKFYDVNGDGNISYEEFLSGLREELTERRLNMVQKAFASLDKDGSGNLDRSDIAGIYDVSMNPEFLEGRKTREELLDEFL